MNDNLIIYGSGDVTSLKLYAESLGIGERVHLPGQISDVPTFIKSARLFVLSSNVEGMPNALMEAMAIGLPCISTDCPCGGPRMLFPESIREYLVPVGDSDTLSKRMLAVLTDSQKQHFLHKNVRRLLLNLSRVEFLTNGNCYSGIPNFYLLISLLMNIRGV